MTKNNHPKEAASSSPMSSPSSDSPPMGSSPVSPSPYHPRPVSPSSTSPPSMTPPLRHPRASRSKSPLLKLLLGIVGVVAVVLITVGVMRFLSDDANLEPETDTVYEEVCQECEEEPCICDELVCEECENDPCICDEVVVCGDCEEYPCICDEVVVCEECEEYPCICLIPLTAPEIFEANAYAVFSIYFRVPDYWDFTKEELTWRFSNVLDLPTGYYVFAASGFFVNADGVAITNHHVVVEQEHMLIKTHGGETYPILGYYTYDIDNDIAIIQVEGSGFQYTTFSEVPLRIGDSVYAIGSPAGDHNTFTDGIISLFAGEIYFNGYMVTDMIQHTAPIYGGNSGGPLFDQFGKVIGVNAARNWWRASVAFAVRIERVDLDSALRTPLTPFPLGGGETTSIIGTWVRDEIEGGIRAIDTINIYEDGTFSELFEFWDVETNIMEEFSAHEGSYQIEDNIIIFTCDEWSIEYEFVLEGNRLTLSEVGRDREYIFMRQR